MESKKEQLHSKVPKYLHYLIQEDDIEDLLDFTDKQLRFYLRNLEQLHHAKENESLANLRTEAQECASRFSTEGWEKNMTDILSQAVELENHMESVQNNEIVLSSSGNNLQVDRGAVILNLFSCFSNCANQIVVCGRIYKEFRIRLGRVSGNDIKKVDEQYKIGMGVAKDKLVEIQEKLVRLKKTTNEADYNRLLKIIQEDLYYLQETTAVHEGKYQGIYEFITCAQNYGTILLEKAQKLVKDVVDRISTCVDNCVAISKNPVVRNMVKGAAMLCTVGVCYTTLPFIIPLALAGASAGGGLLTAAVVAGTAAGAAAPAAMVAAATAGSAVVAGSSVAMVSFVATNASVIIGTLSAIGLTHYYSRQIYRGLVKASSILWQVSCSIANACVPLIQTLKEMASHCSARLSFLKDFGKKIGSWKETVKGMKFEDDPSTREMAIDTLLVGMSSFSNEIDLEQIGRDDEKMITIADKFDTQVFRLKCSVKQNFDEELEDLGVISGEVCKFLEGKQTMEEIHKIMDEAENERFTVPSVEYK